ncbi:MAG: hypothetical protein LBI43_07590 [Streptococcaceae bacterium]|jgi:hypothetical protein|nr:hypothetical protein [Streptococcaceae bacterium]
MAKSDKKILEPNWLDTPENHDYPAAKSYLSLLLHDDDVNHLVDKLDKAETTHFKAKDILRASRLDLLPKENLHVAKDLKKIAKGTALSPVLLVRGDLYHQVPLTIADGYHRVCASYWVDENTDIPVKIVDL